jgi:radical SAM protein with 4Fe4S-binding SPASM domain
MNTFLEDYVLVRGPKNTALYGVKGQEVYGVDSSLIGLLGAVPTISNPTLPMALNRLLRHHPLFSRGSKRNYNPSLCPDVQKEDWFMWLELTNQCNLSCLHCYADGNKEKESLLRLGDWVHLLREGFRLGFKELQFTGGEPTLHPHLPGLIAEASNIGYRLIEVYTNATVLTDKLLRLFQKYKVSVALSFYSHEPSTHDLITGKRGSFRETLQGIKHLLRYSIPLRVGIILMQENETHAQATAQFLEKLGVKSEAIEYDYVRPTGRGRRRPFPPPIQATAIKVRKGSKKGRDAVSPLQELPNRKTCWHGKITINGNGSVYPCIFARDLIVGNVLHESLTNLVKGERLQRLWGITLGDVGTCQECEFRYGCFDCRALAFTSTGDLYSKDPRCNYDPYEGWWKRGTVMVPEFPKRRSDIIQQEVADELLLYDPKTHSVHHLNPMAGVIWEMCDGSHARTQMADHIVSAVKGDKAKVLKDVEKTLKEFYSKGLL